MQATIAPWVFGRGTQPPPGGKRPGDGKDHDADGGRRRPTILVIDDSAQDHELIQAAAQETGIKAQLRFASSGAEAKAYFEGRLPFSDRAKNPYPDLVLLDIQMPDMDGFQVLTWLRSRGDGFRRTPVLMLSTSQRPEEMSRAYDLGANSYLVKPDGFGELCTLLSDAARYWLERNRPA